MNRKALAILIGGVALLVLASCGVVWLAQTGHLGGVPVCEQDADGYCID